MNCIICVLPILMGVLNIIGWCIPTLWIAFFPHVSLMAFNTALSVTCLGIGISMSLKKPLLTFYIGLFVFIISLGTLFEYIFSIHIGLDDLFMSSTTHENTLFPQRMAPNTLLCLFILSLILLVRNLYWSKLRYIITMFSCSVFVTLFCLTTFIGYLIDYSWVYRWGHWTQMSPQTAIALMACGLALTQLFWQGFRLKFYTQHLIPVILILAIGAISFIHLWQYLEEKEHQKIQQNLSLDAKILKDTWLNSIKIYLNYLTQIQRRLSMANYPSAQEWELDAKAAMEGMPGLHSLAVFTTSAKPILSVSNLSSAQSSFETCLREALLRNKRTWVNQHNLCLKLPITYQNKPAFLGAFINITHLVDALIPNYVQESYGLSVYINRQLAYQNTHISAYFDPYWKIKAQVKYDTITFTLEIQPYKLYETPASWLPLISLFSGLLMTILLALSVYMMQAIKRSRDEHQKSAIKLRALLETTSDAIIVINEQGAIELGNQAALSLLGYSKQELCNMNVKDFVPERLKPEYKTFLQKYMQNPVKQLIGITKGLFIKTKSGKEIPIEIGINPIQIHNKNLIICSIHDMSIARSNLYKLEEQNNLLQMMLALANVIANDEPYYETLTNCLAIIGRSIHWPIGHIYMVHDADQTLHPTNIWYMNNPNKFESFRKITLKTIIPYGVNLPGNSLATGLPKLITDLPHAPDFMRKLVCEKLGIKSALAFPIRSKNKIVAIAEFFTTESVENDSNILLIANVIGHQIGHFIEYHSILEENRKLATRFTFAVGAGKIGVWDIDLQTNSLVWDNQMYSIYGLDKHAFTGHYECWEKMVHPDDLKRTQTEYRTAIREQKPFNTEFRIIKPSGNICWIRAHGIVLYSDNNKAKSMLGVNWDITEEKALMEKLKDKSIELERLNKILSKHAYYDPLTGLANLRALKDSSKHLFARALRQNILIAAFYIDIDFFKKVNDLMGHAVGDLLLQKVGHIIAKIVRNEDILCRVGGDEIVALMEIRTEDSADLIAKHILEAFHDPIEIEDHKIQITVSIGIAFYPLHANSLKTLLAHADTALLQAKQHGRNRFELYKPDKESPIVNKP